MSDFIKRLYKNRENIAETKRILENIIKVEGLEDLGIDFIEKNTLNESYDLALANIRENSITNKDLDKSISFKELDQTSIDKIAENIKNTVEKKIVKADFEKILNNFFEKTPLLKKFNQIDLDVYKNCNSFTRFFSELNFNLDDIKRNENVISEFKIINKNNEITFYLKTAGVDEKDNIEIESNNIKDFKIKVDRHIRKYNPDFELNRKFASNFLNVDDNNYLDNINIRKDIDFTMVVDNQYDYAENYILKVNIGTDKEYITKGYTNDVMCIDKLSNILTINNYLESYKYNDFEKNYITKTLSSLEKETFLMRDEIKKRVENESFEDVKNDILATAFKKANSLTSKDILTVLDDEYYKKFEHYSNKKIEEYLLKRNDEFNFELTEDGKIKELIDYSLSNPYDDNKQMYEDYLNTCKKVLKYRLKPQLDDIVLSERIDDLDEISVLKVKEKYLEKETGTIALENEFLKSVQVLIMAEYDEMKFGSEVINNKIPLKLSENDYNDDFLYIVYFSDKLNEILENKYDYHKISKITMGKEFKDINYNEYNDFLERDLMRRTIIESQKQISDREPVKEVKIQFGDIEIKI